MKVPDGLCLCIFHQAVEDIARGLVEQAAEAAAAAQKEASQWKERSVQQTNKVSQLEQKVRLLETDIAMYQGYLVITLMFLLFRNALSSNLITILSYCTKVTCDHFGPDPILHRLSAWK